MKLIKKYTVEVHVEDKDWEEYDEHCCWVKGQGDTLEEAIQDFKKKSNSLLVK